MNRLFIIFAISFATPQTRAITIDVVGKSGTHLFHRESDYTLPSTIGDVSIQAFDFGKVPYEGGVHGVSKLFDLGQDIEIISDTEMKAYGWCFSIDGEVPETMPDETIVCDQISVILWYYAYAHYKDGNWISQCVKD